MTPPNIQDASHAMSNTCPSCQRVLYNRWLTHCGVCGTQIPDSLRFATEGMAALDQRMAELEEQRGQFSEFPLFPLTAPPQLPLRDRSGCRIFVLMVIASGEPLDINFRAGLGLHQNGIGLDFQHRAELPIDVDGISATGRCPVHGEHHHRGRAADGIEIPRTRIAAPVAWRFHQSPAPRSSARD